MTEITCEDEIEAKPVGAEPLNLCPPHLYQRFQTQDFLEGTTVLVGVTGEADACIDCENLDERPYGFWWARGDARLLMWQSPSFLLQLKGGNCSGQRHMVWPGR